MRARPLTKALIVAAALLLGSGCSSSPDDDNNSGSGNAVAAVRLTKAQLKHIQLYTVVPVGYRQRVQAPGVVDFDNDQATSVVSPFTGPVTRILVALGQPVAQGATARANCIRRFRRGDR